MNTTYPDNYREVTQPQLNRIPIAGKKIKPAIEKKRNHKTINSLYARKL
jgi:hypothetical protein